MKQFSPSSLSTFLTCPRQFYYSRVARVKTDAPEQIYTFLGSRFHEAMQYLYGSVKNGTVPSLESVTQQFDRLWNDSWKNEIILPANSSADSWQETGHECITRYYHRNAPFEGEIILGLERKLVFPLDTEGQFTILGFVDRLVKTPNGVWQIHDYKTGGSLPTQQDCDKDMQLALYQIGVQHHWPDASRIELIWHYVRFDETLTSIRTPEQIEELTAKTLELAQDIDSRGRDEEEFPPVESRLCPFCDFQAICPVRKHLFQVSSLPEADFKNDSGVQLVDKWSELRSRLDALKSQESGLVAEIEAVQQAIIALAEHEELDVLVGTDHEAVIKRSNRLLFPRKSITDEAEAAQQLEAALRETSIWEQVSSLHTGRLKRLLADSEDTLDPDTRRLIERFVHHAEDIGVRLRKKSAQ